ncbi:DUF5677 domain-containing protein [Francisellaceae bacterium CB52]
MNNENKDLISIIKDTPKEDGFANIQDKWDEIYEAYDNGKVDEYLHLFQIRSYRTGWNERLLHQYNEAFIEFEIFFERCLSLVQGYYDETDSSKSIYKAIRLIYSNVILRFQEIRCLLKNGFADGAMIAWRSMFENTTAMIYIADNFYNKQDQNIADKFLDWQDFKAYFRADEYNKNALGYEKISNESIESLKEKFQTVANKYGIKIKNTYSTSMMNYGWAGDNMNLDKMIKSGNPHLMPYYNWACQEIHVTPKSHKLGLMNAIYDDQYRPLMNSSNIGLLEPAQISLLCLWQSVGISVASLLNHDKLSKKTKDKIKLDLIILHSDIGKIGKLFSQAEKNIKEEDTVTK